MMQGIPQTFNNKPRRFVWEYRSILGDNYPIRSGDN